MYKDWQWALLLFGFILLSIWFSKILQRKGSIPLWLSRKVLHILAISACATAPLLVNHSRWLAFLVWGAGLLLFWLIRRFQFFEEEGRKNYGIALFTLPFGAMLWADLPAVYIFSSMMILAVSDAAACVFGHLYPIRSWSKAMDGKSIGGSLAFFLSTILIMFLINFNFTSGYQDLPLLSLILLSIWLTLAELMGERGWDNVWVPLFSAVLLPVFAEAPLLNLVLISVFCAAFIWLSQRWHILSHRGAIAASLLGISTYLLADFYWLLPLAFFLVSSSVIGKIFPAGVRSDEKAGKARDEWQVWSNGGVWLIALILAEWIGMADVERNLLILILMEAATADTWSSQIGTWHQGPTWDIFKLRPCSPGLSGGMSAMGTFGGLLGSACVATLGYFLIADFTHEALLMCFMTGILGMITDSLLGSAFQRKYRGLNGEQSDTGNEHMGGLRWINNDVVNFLSQFILLVAVQLWLS